MFYYLRSLLRILRNSHRPADNTVFVRHQRTYERADLLVRLFYLHNLQWCFIWVYTRWISWRDSGNIVPLWPVMWTSYVDPAQAANWMNSVALMCAILGFFVQRRFARILAFIGFIQIYSFTNSFGKINHFGHAWLVVTALFIFLPAYGYKNSDTPSLSHRQQFLTVFAGAQIMVGLFYTMSGFWKISAGFEQLMNNQVHSFHPFALATLVAARIQETNSTTILGGFLLDYPWIGWPLHLMAICLEVSGIIVAFRPTLHQSWGAGIVLFHIGTWLLMDVAFANSVFLVGLLFCLSPFTTQRITIRQVLFDLPIIGDIITMVSTRRSK